MDAANKNDGGNCNRPMTQWIIPDWGYYHTAQERWMKIDISPLFSSQKWIEINDLGSTDDEQRWKKFFKKSWWLPIWWLWWSLIASRVCLPQLQTHLGSVYPS